MSLLFTLGVVFGGIHCFGWYFSFPTYAEQKLWHVASLAVTIIPIGVVPFTIILAYGDVCFPITIVLALAIVSLAALAYVSARLVLLGLALALLRHLPPTAYIAIDWTKFYPHFL